MAYVKIKIRIHVGPGCSHKVQRTKHRHGRIMHATNAKGRDRTIGINHTTHDNQKAEKGVLAGVRPSPFGSVANVKNKINETKEETDQMIPNRKDNLERKVAFITKES